MNQQRPDLIGCNCLALRQASRHVSQMYDRHLAPFDLTLNQFSILAQLATRGPASINELAKNLIMDRTTLSRNLKPLQQAGWITQTPDETDRRSHCLRLSAAGHQHCQLALPAWLAAQTQFEQTFGDAPAASLRQVLQTITQLPLLE